MIPALGVLLPNKSLQRTFDPSRVFAAAKARVASNAAEPRRWVSQGTFYLSPAEGEKLWIRP